jgi:hypothetical protein
MSVESRPGQPIVYAYYNVQSREYSMINDQMPNTQSQSSSTMQLKQPTANSTTRTQSTTTTTAREEGVMQSLQQIPSTPDSFKNNNNKTIQVISATVNPLPGGITMSMTGQIKNTSKDTLRFLTISAQILDSKYKVLGIVIGMAKNNNLEAGQLTSFSGLGNIPQGSHPIFFKLTFEWL